MLAHNVFFKLKESTPENRRKLVEGCQKYLTGHPGTVFFAVGTLAEEYTRPVNDRDFDVGLHLVFESREAQDVYQVAARHLEFVNVCGPLWAKARVFDSDVSGPAT
jgi:hypothetical protein